MLVSLFSGLSQFLIPHFFKKVENDLSSKRQGLDAKNPMKKVYMHYLTKHFGGFNVSDMK